MSLTPRNPIVALEGLRRFKGPLGAFGIALILFFPSLVATIAYNETVNNNNPDQFAQGGFFIGDEFVVDDGMFMDQPFGGGDAENRDLDQFVSSEVLTTLDLQPQATVSIERTGQAMLIGVGSTLAFITFFLVVPAIVGASISSERNNQTLQPIQLSMLRPSQIVLGKLIASIGYIGLVMVCALPVLSIGFLMGGTRIITLASGLMVFLMVVVEVAAMSIALSSKIRNPALSIFAALISTAVLFIGPFILFTFGLWSGRVGSQFDELDTGWALVTSFSPVALISFIGGVDASDVSEKVESIRALALVVWAVVIIVSLRVATSGVRAPMKSER